MNFKQKIIQNMHFSVLTLFKFYLIPSQQLLPFLKEIAKTYKLVYILNGYKKIRKYLIAQV